VSGAVAVILAAGSGERLGVGMPKGFVEVGGRSILSVATEAAAACEDVDALVVTVPSGWEDRARPELPAATPATVVAGGRSRHESVRLALAAVPPGTETVLVHDSARCLATPQLFGRVLAAVQERGADGVVPVVSVPDTVKRVRDGRVVATEPRDELALAQTPQGFRLYALQEAHRRAEMQGLEFTDDAAVLEWAGYAVLAVPGEPENFKITTPEDLARAEALMTRTATRLPGDPSMGSRA
jgi:2-C-methyl-D-erythritol 4-phosphate cytidylyltransferase